MDASSGDSCRQCNRSHFKRQKIRFASTYGTGMAKQIKKEDSGISGAKGIVHIKGVAVGNLANALMKAETKTCRRAVLRLVGLGWLDETETETIEGAVRVDVETATGEIAQGEQPLQAPQAPASAQRGKLARRWGDQQWGRCYKGIAPRVFSDVQALIPSKYDTALQSELMKFISDKGFDSPEDFATWCLTQWVYATTDTEGDGEALPEDDDQGNGEKPWNDV